MRLEDVTAIVLTANEAPNIARCLAALSFVREVLVVDSESTDETPEIVARFPRARLLRRGFDNFAGQWNFALTQGGIRSEWILALDADFIAPPELASEIEALRPAAEVGGYQASFVYCVHGRPLRGSLYPPITVLCRRDGTRYEQEGHAYRVRVPGQVLRLRSRLRHDDRKPLARFLESQRRYMAAEAEVLRAARWDELGWPDRLRRLHVVAPFAVLFYCLVVCRGLLDGKAGLHYAFQRMLAETLLSLTLLDRELSHGPAAVSLPPRDGV